MGRDKLMTPRRLIRGRYAILWHSCTRRVNIVRGVRGGALRLVDHPMHPKKTPNINTSIDFFDEHLTTPSLIFPPDDSTRQLEDGHPACLRDLDEANEHHFIGGDIAMAHKPVKGSDRNALAVLS
jgi:hypothetical protein